MIGKIYIGKLKELLLCSNNLYLLIKKIISIFEIKMYTNLINKIKN